MPVYEYRCITCDAYGRQALFSLVEKEPPKRNPWCPNCSSYNTLRVWNVPFVRFTGSGFYSTDHPKDGDKVNA